MIKIIFKLIGAILNFDFYLICVMSFLFSLWWRLQQKPIDKLLVDRVPDMRAM